MNHFTSFLAKRRESRFMLISLLYHYARFPWNIPIEKEELLSAPLFINLILLFEIRLDASAKF
jgi:hypothetical protein